MKLISNYVKQQKERDQYFRVGKSEITTENLVMLKQVSAVTTILVGLFILITPYLIKDWTPTIWHILFLPASAAFFFLAGGYELKEKTRDGVVSTLCLSFIACLFLFVSAIDVYQAPHAPSSFFPLVLIAVPCLFTFRFRVVYTELVLFELIYVLLLFLNKTDYMARNDTFNSLVGFVISFVVARLIHRLRMESFQAKNLYKKLSMTDGLTGIMNKSNCEEAVAEFLKQRSEEEDFALMILDVDNFKLINDRMGHQAGDEVLGGIGAALLQVFRSTDIVGRIGGDEFMVCLRNLPDQDVVSRKCQRLFGCVDELSRRLSSPLTCSIGISYVHGKAKSYEELFQAADNALYEAKVTGKARFAIHQLNAQPEPGAIDPKKPLMLIADDNEVNRVILKAALEGEYEVIQAENGTEALDKISVCQDLLSVILLDLVMPDIDGYKILRYIKERSRTASIPVVVITADSNSEKDVLQLGAADMIAKPFDAEIVQIRVRNAVKTKDRS